MRLRSLVSAAAALFFVGHARAQTYQPGLLVRANGDTLRGEIENNFWLDPPKFIRFRPTPSSAPELLRPRQLHSVLFAQGRYFRFEALPIDHAAETRPDRLAVGDHPNIHVDSVLAEVLVEGPATLLRVPRFGATHYLVRRPDQPVLDLSERKYLYVSKFNVVEVRDGNNYKGQLGLFFGDCPAASAAIPAAPFTPEALAGIVEAYNTRCAAGQPASRSWVAQAEAPAHRAVALQGGLVAGAIYYHSSSAEYGGFPAQLQPFGGVYGEMLLPNRAIGAFAELVGSNFHGHGSFTASYVQVASVVNGTTVYTTVPVTSTYDYRTWLATARLGLRFYFPLPRNQRGFLGAGLEYNQMLHPVFTTVSGPVATPDDHTFSTGFGPLPFFSLGWRAGRTTVKTDALFYPYVLLSARLGLSYRLSRNPDAARPQ